MAGSEPDSDRASSVSAFLPLLATVGATASFQVGAAIAKGLFPLIGAEGAAALRLSLGAVFLMVLVRPWRAWPAKAPLLPLVVLGFTVGGVILLFYLALERLPLALTIALQFLGPLGVAVAGSRRPRDLLWPCLAAAGVWMLLGVRSSGPVDPLGVVFALASAAGWAGYILCGRVASRSFGGSTGPVALTLAAMLVLPIGIFQAGPALLSPAVVPVALLMAVFAAAIPFSLEFYSLPRLPARTFAIMTSLEPVFGVLAGWAILHETLSPTRLAGVAVVVVAAAGAAWSSGRDRGQPEPPLVTP